MTRAERLRRRSWRLARGGERRQESEGLLLLEIVCDFRVDAEQLKPHELPISRLALRHER